MEYAPHITEFKTLLGEERLRDYWKKHESNIVRLDLQNKDISVRTVNYIADYSDYLKPLYEELGKFIKEAVPASPQPQ